MAEYKSQWLDPFKEARNQNKRLFVAGTRQTEYTANWDGV